MNRVLIGACFLAWMLSLGSCTAPPGSSGTPTGDPIPARGMIVLPDGVSSAVSTLRVATTREDATVGEDGSVEADVLADGPTLVQVFDPATDKLVLLGYLDASSSTPSEINAKSTAVALLYFALGAYTLPQGNTAETLELIAATPQCAELTATIEARLVANPTALSDDDAEVYDAVLAAADAVREAELNGSQLRTRSAKSRTLRTAQAEDDALILLHPDANTQQSGLTALQNPDGPGFVVTNSYRRRARMFVYRTGTADAQGALTEVSPPEEVVADVNVPSTFRLELISALFSPITGATAFAPVTTAPTVLERDPNAAKTYYEIVILGPAFSTELAPIMSDARFFPFAGEWNDALDSARFEMFTLDFLLPIVETAGFGQIAAVRTDAVNAALSRWRSLMDPVLLQGGIALTSQSGFAQAVHFILASMGPREQTVFTRQWVEIAQEALEESAANQIDIAQSTRNMQRFASAARILAAVQAVLEVGDLAAITHDLASSNDADSWQATVISRTVRLEPSEATVTQNSPSVILTATVSGLADADLLYRWSTEGRSGAIFGTLPGTEGQTFDTTEKEVQYIADIPAIIPGEIDTVTVEVFEDPGDGQIPADAVSLGSATAVINGPLCVEPGEIVDIPDRRFRAYIAAQLNVNTNAITCGAMETLTSVNPGSIPNLNSIEGIEYAVNLESFSCGLFCLLDDEAIKPLADLHKLRFLDLSSNPISDLSPLRNLTQLESFAITSGVSDLSPISGATGMKSLDIRQTDVTSLAPLASMSGLLSINAHASAVTDISGLAGKPQMNTVILSSTHVSDISALADAESLETLDLEFADVEDISALANKPSLRTLDLSGNNVKDVSPLRESTELTLLDLADNQVMDIEPLTDLLNMANLNLDRNDIDTLIPLRGMTGMRDLYVSLNPRLGSLEGVNNMGGLINFGFGFTAISDLSPLLQSGAQLTVLDLRCVPAANDTDNIQEFRDRGIQVFIRNDNCDQ
ncbi:MAG: leucine-rich repeat domain-containing protein [Phycisphaerales bacterium]|nr:leucine-rich repeat domain-containing protein [Phycisphaerales bacterium]